MNLLLHDEDSNEYLSRMFWKPLVQYSADIGLPINRVEEIDTAKNSVVLIHGDKLSPERIRRLAERNNIIVCFDINDSSYLSSAYVNSPEQHLLSLIFKVSGVPKQNEVNEVNLDRNFRIQISREKYLPDPQWEQFQKLKPIIKPLPYVLWEPLVGPNESIVPQASRSGKVLIRGGNHFWRVVLAFRLMQEGLLDERSEFHTAAYFSPTMEKRFQYCDSCKAERSQHGRSLYDAPVRRSECTSPVTGWEIPGEFFGGPMFGRHEHGWWNNKCPHSFMFLAKEYERCRGPLDHPFLERLFNGDVRPKNEFIWDLSHASYAADLKWLLTINFPPRFWEAASLGTPSLYAKRCEDQDYWPPVNEGEHYLTFQEDMEEFNFQGKDWNAVSRAVKASYEANMRGTEYAISTPLLQHMMTAIRDIL